LNIDCAAQELLEALRYLTESSAAATSGYTQWSSGWALLADG
jgi:hypothetical protein